MRRTVVLDVAGLSPSLLGADTPCLNRLAGSAARIRPLCLPRRRNAAGLLLLALVVLYNLCHKRTPLAVIPMGASRSLIYVIAGLAISASLPLPLLVLAALQFGYVLLLTVLARLEKGSTPLMLAGISLLDGIFLACTAGAAWLAAGVAGAAATLAMQGRIRGD